MPTLQTVWVRLHFLSDSSELPNSSTPGESSRPPDSRVYGMRTRLQRIFFIRVPLPSRLYENHDARHHHTWEVLQSGDGLIQALEPTAGDTVPPWQKPIDMRIERDVVEKLVDAYFLEIAPILPVITQAEFLPTPSPPPTLFYSICLVAAAQREVPQNVRRNTLHRQHHYQSGRCPFYNFNRQCAEPVNSLHGWDMTIDGPLHTSLTRWLEKTCTFTKTWYIIITKGHYSQTCTTGNQICTGPMASRFA
ncbi:hypothetical protein V8E52_008356 [Russula decolorans]